VLNNVPSVSVDTDGQVSLRGDGNVTILIDGRPSAQSSGSDPLAQVLAKDIDKIEVITNPPAEYKANGSGGMINIVTKKSRSPGLSGSALAKAGNGDRYQLGLSGSYKKDALTLSGGVNLKQDTRTRAVSQRRTFFDPASNTFVANDQTTRKDTRRVTPSIKLGADYKLGESETIGASFSHAERRGDRDSVQQSAVRDSLGALQKNSRRIGDGKEWRLDGSEAIHYVRGLATRDDRLSLNLQQSARRQRDKFDYLTTFNVAGSGSGGRSHWPERRLRQNGIQR
jgi:outer membrane receptor for ferrienterochelin and colicin